MGAVNSNVGYFNGAAADDEDIHGALDPGGSYNTNEHAYRIDTGIEPVSDEEDIPGDRNMSDTTTSYVECNPTTGRDHRDLDNDDTVHIPTVPASDRDTHRTDGAWNIFTHIKESLGQLGGRRSPGIYDDRKSAPATINFNNNELYNDVNLVCSDGLTRLTKAVRERDVEQVECLLTHPDVNVDLREDIPHTVLSNYREPDRTALIVAVHTGQTDIVKLLLHAGADVNITDGDQCSALFHAADGDHCDIVKLLLQYGASVESVNSYRDPLYTACRHGHIDIVECLLTAGSAVNRPTDRNQPSVLSVAMESSSEELCLKLLRMGAHMITGNKTNEPFIAACQYGYPVIVSTCIKAGCDPNMQLANNISPIQAAIKLCNFQTDRAVLYGNSMTHPNELSPRAKEIFKNRMCIVDVLCDNGCSLNEDIDSVPVLAKAIQIDNLPCAYILLRHGAKWDIKCNQYLVKAYDTISKHMINLSDISLMQSIIIPKIVNILSHTERAAFQRETTLPVTVPNLKDSCRHVIRLQLRQQTNKSILPYMSALHLPSLLQDYLCYNDSGRIENILL